MCVCGRSRSSSDNTSSPAPAKVEDGGTGVVVADVVFEVDESNTGSSSSLDGDDGRVRGTGLFHDGDDLLLLLWILRADAVVVGVECCNEFMNVSRESGWVDDADVLRAAAPELAVAVVAVVFARAVVAAAAVLTALGNEAVDEDRVGLKRD